MHWVLTRLLSEGKISHLAAPVKIAKKKVVQSWNWRDVCGENDTSSENFATRSEKLQRTLCAKTNSILLVRELGRGGGWGGVGRGGEGVGRGCSRPRAIIARVNLD